MTEILDGLRDSQRERVAALREAGEFFWMDVSLGETSLDDLVEALDLPDRAAQALASQGEAGGPSRGFDVAGHLFKKYGNLLTAADWVYLEPIPQHDWLAIFRLPWIRGQLS